jgi:hypothetical protein
MIWDGLREWLENPILIKHVRSRLRPQAFFSALVVVVVLCLCIAYAGYELDMFMTGGAAGWLLCLQIVIMVIMASSQVNASVNGARASGILDFHRVTPMTPTELTFGFFFGAPIREYLLFASTLPFLLICMAFGVPSPRAAIQLMILLITTGWCFQGLALLNGLISKSKTATGNVIGTVVILTFLFINMLMTGRWYSVNLAEGEQRMSFYGISLPWLPVVLLYQLPFLFFILLASCRKMQSARLHPLSKPQAIVAMVTFAALILGGIWRQEQYDVLGIVALYLLTVPAILLTMMVTPNQAEYYKGLWRAQKQGRNRLPWWDDLSINGVALALIAGIVLAAGTMAWSFPGATSPGYGRPQGSFPLALATAVLVVAYFGLALQYFQLRFAGRAKTYFGLFLFLTWALPMVAGTIQGWATGPMRTSEAAYPFYALSPIGGIGMVAAIGDEGFATAIQSSAITPALLFTFVFNYLLIGARKRVIKAVYIAAANLEPTPAEAAPFAPVPHVKSQEPLSEEPVV